MLPSEYSDYYGKRPDEVVIPEGWERLPRDWFRKPLLDESYVNNIGTVAQFAGSVLKSNPDRVIIKRSRLSSAAR